MRKADTLKPAARQAVANTATQTPPPKRTEGPPPAPPARPIKSGPVTKRG